MKCLHLISRNKYKIEAVVSVLLAVLVAVLGYWLLLADFFKDFWIFVFCFVLAGCQFSLIKVSRFYFYTLKTHSGMQMPAS